MPCGEGTWPKGVAQVTLSAKNASKSNVKTTHKVTFGSKIYPSNQMETIVIAAFTLLIGMFLGALFMSLLVISRSDD
jgi:hypothetical protein